MQAIPKSSAPHIAVGGSQTGFAPLADVARILRETYGDPHHSNKRNPLWELIFILCSVQTDEKKYMACYRALRCQFPSFASLARVSEKQLAGVLAPSGRGQIKAKAMRMAFDHIIERFGSLTLAPLSNMTNEESESFLTTIPFIGKKVARCVLMCSLKRAVFPVDTHCWRIAQRLGWARATRKSGICTQSDMDRLQDVIPAPLRYSLHVNMLSHGRIVCTPARPACNSCSLRSLCPRVGL